MSSTQEAETAMQVDSASLVPENMKYKYEAKIPFDKAEWAEYVCKALAVDKELKQTIVHKNLRTEDNALIVTFHAVDLKMLRTVVWSFFDFLILATKTIEAFA